MKGEEGEAREGQEAELGLSGPRGEADPSLPPAGPLRVITLVEGLRSLREEVLPGVRIYHLCDAGKISTRQLVEVLAAGMGRPARLLSLPRMLALTAGTLLGKGAQVRRLYGNLEVDGSDFCRDYAWQPTLSLEDGLREMARSFSDGD